MIMNAYPYAASITLLVLLLLFATAAMVGRARVRYGVKAPASSGHELFERAFRIQMNTLENAVQMLPALWLCAIYGGDRWAGLIGLVWLLAMLARLVRFCSPSLPACSTACWLNSKMIWPARSRLTRM